MTDKTHLINFNNMDIMPLSRVSSDENIAARFRDNILWPLIKDSIDNDCKVTINIDNVFLMDAASIDDVFSGILRNYNITKEQLLNHLEIVCSKPDKVFFKDAILHNIKNYED